MRFFCLLFLIASLHSVDLEPIVAPSDQKIVIQTKRLEFDRFPDAFNPSIAQIDDGFLLIFRYCPDPGRQPWISQIGIVRLNRFLDPVAEPQILNTRPKKRSKTPSQAEDARFFTYQGRLHLIWNDNVDELMLSHWRRRDLFIAELLFSDGKFSLTPPTKLYYGEMYDKVLQQKNWSPFEYNGTLFYSYSIHPHEVITSPLLDGECYFSYKTTPEVKWKYGSIRGSSEAQLVDGEYLAFFHSATRGSSSASYGYKLWHYFAGAYTFSATPPFTITKMTPVPLIGDNFFTRSGAEKRVVMPGGFVVRGSLIYMAYGKDDREIWIATLDKEALKRALVPVTP